MVQIEQIVVVAIEFLDTEFLAQCGKPVRRARAERG